MNADLIAKIQKLRALAQSTNVNEAANAAAAAERLIAEHQLTAADLGTTTEVPDEPTDWAADPLFAHDGEKRVYWKEWLAGDLARLYSCALNCTYVRVKVKVDTYPYEGTAWRTGFAVVGRPSDVETLRYQFAYLTSEIERLTQAFLRDNRFAKGEAKTAANNFRVGASEGVTRAMAYARRTQTEEHTATAGNDKAAMVLVKHLDLATAKLRARRPDLFREDGTRKGGRSVTTNTNYAAREAGRRAGAGLHNSGALPASATRQLGRGR